MELAYRFGSVAVILVVLAPLFGLLALHYRRSHHRGLILILVGLLLIPAVSILELVIPAYDIPTIVGNQFVSMPRPSLIVYDSLVVIAHGCITLGLLGELFPAVNARIEQLFDRVKPPTPGESKSL